MTGFWIVTGISTLIAVSGAESLEAGGPIPALPFGIGEELVYQVHAGRFGKIGKGIMRVEGPEPVRGRETYLLHFDVEGRVGPFKIEDCTRSWLDPAGPAALRYEKRERHPLSSNVEEIDLFPGENRWAAANGETGTSLTALPLDELSFIYIIRSLDLEPGTEISLDRHYHAERNPVLLQVLRREVITLPAGVFSTIVVEMQVRDGRRFNGSGTIRLYLTDDANRYPIRIETAMPIVGKLVLELDALTPASGNSLQGSGLLLETMPH